MGILSWIILGAVAGWLASMVMKTDAQMGWVGNIVVGIVGAVVGGYIASMMGWGTVDGFNIGSIVIALGGAVIVLFLLKLVTGRKAV